VRRERNRDRTAQAFSQLGGSIMTTEIKNQRFSLCGERYIVDKLNADNNGDSYYSPRDPDDDMSLREGRSYWIWLTI
jgi:hypothetical protein